jgi:hypothetical protein
MWEFCLGGTFFVNTLGSFCLQGIQEKNRQKHILFAHKLNPAEKRLNSAEKSPFV